MDSLSDLGLFNRPRAAGRTLMQSFPITSDRPDMSGKTEVGPTKYPATSDLPSGYFFGQFCFSVVFLVSVVRISH